MLKSNQRWKLGALILLATVFGCDATRSFVPNHNLRDGQIVSAIGKSSASLPGLDGKLVTKVIADWVVEASIEDGLAEAQRSSSAPGQLRLRTSPNGSLEAPIAATNQKQAVFPVLAVRDDHALARGRARTWEVETVKDRNGATHTFISIIGSNGGPAQQLIHLKNKQVSEVYRYSWERVEGGWLASSFGVAVFLNGKVRAQFKSEATPKIVADASDADCECPRNHNPS